MIKQFILFLFILPSAWAQVCAPETTLSWILEETELSHPKFILQRLSLEKLKAAKSEAGKIINPELEHFSVWGKEFGGFHAYQNETRLWFTLQLASKRQKSLDAWSRQTDMALQEEVMLRQALLKDLWINFFRMHQISEALNAKNILIGRLNKILSKYKQRKFLTPDQTLEERIFTMVVDNFSLSLAQLERERIDILEFFREVTAFKCPITKIDLEESKMKWPNIDALKKLNTFEALNVQFAQLDLEFSKAKFNLAEAKKMPNLRLSPVVQNYINDDVSNTMAGISFVMPLPFFDRNQSERTQNFLDQKYAERRLDLTKTREDFYFEAKIKKYSLGSSVLQEIDVIQESLSRFKSLGDAFSEGKLSISNIVEFCRQLDEIIERYHKGESVLMMDLMDIFEQRGRLDRQTLENLL